MRVVEVNVVVHQSENGDAFRDRRRRELRVEPFPVETRKLQQLRKFRVRVLGPAPKIDETSQAVDLTLSLDLPLQEGDPVAFHADLPFDVLSDRQSTRLNSSH